MIARVWRCSAEADKAPLYLSHFQNAVLPELNEIDGFRGAYVLQRDMPNGVELTVMTLWESMAAIRRFAGDKVDNAVVEPAAQAVLQSFETTGRHHEVLVSPS